MATASTAGAVADWLAQDATLTGLLGGSFVWRNRPPAGQPPPYLTVRDGIAVAPVRGDLQVIELVQVDVWQATWKPDDSRAELPQLPGVTWRRLQQAILTETVWGRVSLEVDGSVSIDDPDQLNLQHTAITVRVIRQP